MTRTAPRVLVVAPAGRTGVLDPVLRACSEAVVLCRRTPADARTDTDTGTDTGMAAAHADRVAVGHYTCDEQAVALARRCDARRRLDAVVTTWEGAVETAAAIAHALGLPGNSPAAARAGRDKAVAAGCFRRAAVPHPRTWFFDARDEPAMAGHAPAYPFVVKIPRSTNSHSVTLVRGRAELAAALASIRRLYLRDRANRLFDLYTPDGADPAAQPVLAQEYVSGPEFNVDLLMTRTDHVVLGVFEKHPATGPTFGELHSVHPAALTSRGLRELVDLAVAAARALGATRGAAHVEVRQGAHGPVVIEAGLRPGGFLTPVAIERLTGVHPVTALTDLMVTGRLPSVAPPARGRACLYGAVNVTRSGRVTQITGEDQVRALPGVVLFEVVKRPGDRLVTLPEGTDYHVARFLVEGARRRDVESTARRIRALLRVELADEPTGGPADGRARGTGHPMSPANPDEVPSR